MRILFVNGSRGEWGYIKPIIELAVKKNIEYSICATNMLLLGQHGKLVDEIEDQGYVVGHKIYMSMDGGNHSSMAKSLGVFATSFVDVLISYKPDWVILAGDRGEQLAAAIASSYSYVPTAHIQAGELSGNIDGLARHAIGKLVHLHFAANQDAADRLLKLGEEAWRIHNVGAPQLDDMHNRIPGLEEISKEILPLNYILCVYHAVTEEFDKVTGHIKTFCDAVKKYDMKRVWILPNNDAGSSLVRAEIIETMSKDLIFDNLSREKYLSLLKNCHCIIGNSSSGILEAPFYNIPAINIGNRQYGRIQANNIVNCGNAEDEIKQALHDVNQINRKNIQSAYGDGNSSSRILQLLEEFNDKDDLLTKRMTY
jgi:GDP/UDP-N,N'-diacetylbacillosamine 2-epimerase (hydrolysing)